MKVSDTVIRCSALCHHPPLPTLRHPKESSDQRRTVILTHRAILVVAIWLAALLMDKGREEPEY